MVQTAKISVSETNPEEDDIVPDICDSTHDCDLKITDAWLGPVADSILNSLAFDQNSLLVLTFDEGTSNEGCCDPSPLAQGGRVATVLISLLVKKSFEDSTVYSHYSLLETISSAWKFEKLGHASDKAINLIAPPLQSRKLQN